MLFISDHLRGILQCGLDSVIGKVRVHVHQISMRSAFSQLSQNELDRQPCSLYDRLSEHYRVVRCYKIPVCHKNQFFTNIKISFPILQFRLLGLGHVAQIIRNHILGFLNIIKRILHFGAVEFLFVIGEPDGGHAVADEVGNGAGF